MVAMSLDKLTNKQRRFVEEYCGDCKYNATKAAIAAGYAEKNAGITASKNLRKEVIKNAIREFMDVLTEKSIVTREMIVEGMLEIAKSTESNETARLAAWKALSDFTGGFDANKQKVEHSGGIDLSGKTEEELVDIIRGSGYSEDED